MLLEGGLWIEVTCKTVISVKQCSTSTRISDEFYEICLSVIWIGDRHRKLMQRMNHTNYLYAAKFLAERNSVAGTLHFFTTGKQTLTKHMLNTECSHCSTSLACGALEDVKRCLFLERFAILDTLRLQSLHWCVEIKSRINYLFAIRTIIQSTEAATASSSSSPTCLHETSLPARKFTQ